MRGSACRPALRVLRAYTPPRSACVRSQELQEPVVERDNLDEEIDGLWAQLQQALATRRELQRKVVSAQKATQLWEANRQAVHQLAEAYQPDGAPPAAACLADASGVAANSPLPSTAIATPNPTVPRVLVRQACARSWRMRIGSLRRSSRAGNCCGASMSNLVRTSFLPRGQRSRGRSRYSSGSRTDE